jgi:hypothetical protein
MAFVRKLRADRHDGSAAKHAAGEEPAGLPGSAIDVVAGNGRAAWLPTVAPGSRAG